MAAFAFSHSIFCFHSQRACSFVSLPRNKQPLQAVVHCSRFLPNEAGGRNYAVSYKNRVKRMAQQGRCKQRWKAVASETAQREASEEVMKDLVKFLEADLPHLFDEQGIDTSRYDDTVDFRDPITKYERLDGYLFNIQLLRRLFSPKFELHEVQQTGINEISTRWTMRMNFSLLPWKPELIFTGTSVMKVNPHNGKFCSHLDFWDSIENNEYFSFEGLMDVLRQLRIYKLPDLETPAYKVLKRTAKYEVREYEPFIVVEAECKEIVGSRGFNDIAGYIFGKNERGEKIEMTTPVFNQKLDDPSSTEKIQIIIPRKYRLSDLPSPLSKGINFQEKFGGFAGVHKFSGKLSEDVVIQKEHLLRAALRKDRLDPQQGFLLARYNDPGRTPEFMQRHEVLIWLKNFTFS